MHLVTFERRDVRCRLVEPLDVGPRVDRGEGCVHRLTVNDTVQEDVEDHVHPTRMALIHDLAQDRLFAPVRGDVVIVVHVVTRIGLPRHDLQRRVSQGLDPT